MFAFLGWIVVCGLLYVYMTNKLDNRVSFGVRDVWLVCMFGALGWIGALGIGVMASIIYFFESKAKRVTFDLRNWVDAKARWVSREFGF